MKAFLKNASGQSRCGSRTGLYFSALMEPFQMCRVTGFHLRIMSVFNAVLPEDQSSASSLQGGLQGILMKSCSVDD